MVDSREVTFVFEVCAGQHWSRRIDETKYQKVFAEVSAAIRAVVPQANCVMNKVPKRWAEKDIYCQLVANEDDNNPYYDMVPRPYAFEVSTVTNDSQDILFFSKLLSLMWPHRNTLSNKIAAFLEEVSMNISGAELRSKYFTDGKI